MRDSQKHDDIVMQYLLLVDLNDVVCFYAYEIFYSQNIFVIWKMVRRLEEELRSLYLKVAKFKCQNLCYELCLSVVFIKLPNTSFPILSINFSPHYIQVHILFFK